MESALRGDAVDLAAAESAAGIWRAAHMASAEPVASRACDGPRPEMRGDVRQRHPVEQPEPAADQRTDDEAMPPIDIQKSAMASLRWNWGSAYHAFGVTADGRCHASPRGEPTEIITADSPQQLRDKIHTDYAARRVRAPVVLRERMST